MLHIGFILLTKEIQHILYVTYQLRKSKTKYATQAFVTSDQIATILLS